MNPAGDRTFGITTSGAHRAGGTSRTHAGVAGRTLLSLALAAGWFLAGGGHVPAVGAASQFGTPTATAAFNQSITFSQPVTLDATIQYAEILITFPATGGPAVSDVTPPTTSSGPTTLQYRLDLASGHLLPNTKLTARWRLTTTTGRVDLGPLVSITYADTRFQWQSQAGSLVTIHWYQGSADFGSRALAIAERGVSRAEQLLGVTESAPVDFFVYADQQAFYDALGPGTRENVGGQADPDIRTLFALITPSDVNAGWVSVVIPHELTHLVFDTAVRNSYHFPPRWLNEGLAVYLSQGYDASDRATVRSAAASGALIPLDGLVGQFPTSGDQFAQAYAESVSAVDFLIRTHGQDALVRLIRSYHGGLTDDQAFSAAIGLDSAGFGRAWFADNGATIPARTGPQPAPVGPVPSDWASGGTTAQAPGASAAAPTSAPVTASAPSAPADDGSGLRLVGLGLAIVALVVALAGGLSLRASRARSGEHDPRPPDVGPPGMGPTDPGTSGPGSFGGPE